MKAFVEFVLVGLVAGAIAGGYFVGRHDQRDADAGANARAVIAASVAARNETVRQHRAWSAVEARLDAANADLNTKLAATRDALTAGQKKAPRPRTCDLSLADIDALNAIRGAIQ